MSDIDDLFGGPDAPDSLSDTPTEGVIDEGTDKFPDGFASSPRKADADDMAPVMQDIIEDKVEIYNEEFEDASDRNDEVTEDMLAAVSVRGMGAYAETSAPNASLMTWTLGRQNEFLEKQANADENAGFTVDDAYTQDDDLAPRGFDHSSLKDDEVNPGNGPDLR
jgi:hypothetical protein